LSEVHKKENLSDETIRRMSNSAKKLWSNEEYKNRRLQELKEAKDKVPYIYRPMSDTQKQILSNARKEKCSGINNPKARRVWCVELELLFETIKEAGEYFNAKQSTYKKIGNCCSGTRNTCMGYHWMYYEDYLNSTEEDIQKILNKPNNTNLSNNGRAKAVKCVETNEEWLSAEEAAICYGVNGENVRRSCREGSALKLNGCHFVYI
jgi:hypothetical protein